MRADLAFAGVCAMFGVAYLWNANQIPRLMIGDPLGPRAFPMILAAMLLLGCAMLVWETLSRRRAESGAPEDKPAGGMPKIEPMVVITLVALVPIAFLLETVGYVICFSALIMLISTLLRPDRWISNLVWSVVFSCVIYLFMAKFLGAGLPRGILPL
jgi:putative tricarboxylic transport membrane protein